MVVDIFLCRTECVPYVPDVPVRFVKCFQDPDHAHFEIKDEAGSVQQAGYLSADFIEDYGLQNLPRFLLNEWPKGE